MTFETLTASNVRNLENISLNFSPDINLFYGSNGAGKTSLLESLHLLSLGRSFRSYQANKVITSGQSALIVSALWQGMRIGIERRTNGEGTLRVNQETRTKISDLTKQIPLMLFYSQSFQLVEGAPELRRQFMDWPLFHVKPNFHSLWQRFQKSLKQRNTYLRSESIDDQLLDLWDIQLTEPSLILDKQRKEILQELNNETLKYLDYLLPKVKVELSYRKGWPENKIEKLSSTKYQSEETTGSNHNLTAKMESRDIRDESDEAEQVKAIISESAKNENSSISSGITTNTFTVENKNQSIYLSEEKSANNSPQEVLSKTNNSLSNSTHRSISDEPITSTTNNFSLEDKLAEKEIQLHLGTLKQARQGDIKAGYTRNGPHRGDLKIKCHQGLAKDVLSRGQTKLLVIAMKLAQISLVRKQRQGKIVVLIDDLPSELDAIHRRKVCQLLSTLDVQLFITGMDREQLLGDWQFLNDSKAEMDLDKNLTEVLGKIQQREIKTFHVKQGDIKADQG